MMGVKKRSCAWAIIFLFGCQAPMPLKIPVDALAAGSEHLIIQPESKFSQSSREGVIKKQQNNSAANVSYKNNLTNEKLIHKKDGNSAHKKVLIEWEWPTQGKVVKKFSEEAQLSK